MTGVKRSKEISRINTRLELDMGIEPYMDNNDIEEGFSRIRNI
jgi:hypothetical protein